MGYSASTTIPLPITSETVGQHNKMKAITSETNAKAVSLTLVQYTSHFSIWQANKLVRCLFAKLQEHERCLFSNMNQFLFCFVLFNFFCFAFCFCNIFYVFLACSWLCKRPLIIEHSEKKTSPWITCRAIWRLLKYGICFLSVGKEILWTQNLLGL